MPTGPATPGPLSHSPGLPSDVCTLRQAFAIANRAVLLDITSNAIATMADFDGAPTRCWDTRPMLDPRECSAEAIDMATEALGYAERCGLLHRHPQQRYLVRLTGGGL